MKRIVLMLALMLPCESADSVASMKSKTFRRQRSFQSPLTLLQLRGGSDRPSSNNRNSIVQLNPNFTDQTKQYTLGDLDEYSERSNSFSRVVPTQYFFVEQTHGQSLWQVMYRYAQALLKNSPPLFATSASCIAIFLLWHMPYFQSILQRHFVASRFNMRKGRYSVALMSALSHREILHLVFNLSSFLMLGPKVQRVLELSNISNWTSMWFFLVGSALTSSALFLVCERSGAMLGLSGVTTGLLAMYARSFPNEILGILVAGIIPVRMSANQLLQLTVLWSILGTLVALTGRPQKIAHSAHLGGLLFGMTYHELWRRRLRLRGPRQLLRTRTWKS